MNQRKPQKPDPIELVKKYLFLLWQKKIWIIFISIFVAIAWGVVFKFFIQKEREFTSTAVIKFEDPRSRSVGAMTDFANIGAEGNVAILNSGSFLNTVVDSLNLNLFIKTAGISRYDLFKYIDINKNVKFGDYDLTLENNSVTVYYSNKREDIKNRILKKLPLSASDTLDIEINGLNIGIEKLILLELKKIELGLNPNRVVVDFIKGRLITSLDRRTQTLLTVSFTSTHPFDAANTLRIITQMYIDKLLEVKRHKTSNVLTSLQEQLEVSKRELEISENKLKNFRERNPYLFLSDAGSELVSDLSDAQAEISQREALIQRISSAINDINTSSLSDDEDFFLDLMNIMEENNILGAQQLISQYNTLLEEKSTLISSGYSMQSMQMEQTVNRINSVKNNILNKAQSYLTRLNSEKSENQATISQNQRRLQRLPQNEIRLAELQRDRDVKAQIYSNILVRYNEAKISDAAVIPDALIIDEAEVPIDYGGGDLIMYLVGPILGLFLAIGIFVGLDFLNSNIRDTSDVEDKIGIQVLSTIPVILDDGEIPDKLKTERELDMKLITSSYAPNIASEKFRLLRTKIAMNDKKSNSLILTSLAANEGKSLIAANLAITFAQLKVPTVLIDCDLRRGVLHNSFKCNKKPGISDLLVKNVPITQEEITNIIQSTHVPNLFLISSGMQVPNPSELLGGLRMQQFLSALENKFSRIIIDTPPIDILPDALVLNNIIHNFIFVVRHNRTKVNKVQSKIEEYSSIKQDLQGVIINGVPSMKGDEYHSYSYYHY